MQPTQTEWIDLRAQGKMWGQLSSDGRWIVFKRRGMVVEFDVQRTLAEGRAVSGGINK